MQKYALDFLTVTEKAALSAFKWVGSGQKNAADKAATDTMRKQLNTLNFSGEIVIGEGEIDEAPMLYIGEKVGLGKNPELDIAVDPIEGTTPTINGQENGITVIVAAPKGTLFHAPDMYMKKIVVGKKAKGSIDIRASILDNVENVAFALNKKLNDLNVMIQDRPRHKESIKSMRALGVNVHLFQDNDVIASLLTNMENSNIDMMYNIGGAPEGVISAVAIKSLGGDMQACLMPKSDIEISRCKMMGINDVNRVLTLADLVRSENSVFSATAITHSSLLKGIEKNKHKQVTHSVLITGKEKRARFIETIY